MSDLVKRLRIKAGMIEMGERIAWGSDSALMREAADALENAARGAREDYKLVPVEPTLEHIDSIAMRYRHDFGLLPEDQRDNLRRFARQMYEECTGQGFYQIQPAPAVQGEPVGYIRKSALDLLKNDELGVRANIIKEPRYRDCVAIYTSAQPAEEIGEVVVTKDKMGNIVSVTRQDAEGRVLSVIAESEGISQSGVLAEGYFHPLPDESDYEFHDAEQFPDGSNCPACVPAVIVRKSVVTNQPAPDVAGLVGLLRDIGDVCRQLEMPSERAIAEWADRIDAALAAHRQQETDHDNQ